VRRFAFHSWFDFELFGARGGRWIWAWIILVAMVAALILSRIALPPLAESRIRGKLEPLGFQWTSGSSSVDFGSLSFEGVTIENKATRARVAQLGSLRVELSWLRALYSPRTAIEHIHAARVEVELELDELSELYAGRLASDTGSSEAPGAAAPSDASSPTLTIEGARFSLRDLEGPLLVVDVPKAAVDGARWEAELARLELGSSSGEFASFENIRGSGPRVGRRVQLGRLHVGAATLVWNLPESDESTRARQRLIDRMRNARAKLRREPSTRVAADGERTPLWTPDARFELRDARVLEGPGTSGPAILEQLDVDLLAEGDASIRVKGDGATPAEGSLSWNLHVTPSDAKVEGSVALRAVPLVLFTPVLPALPFHELEQTRVEADLAITGRGLESAAVRGELSISDLAFQSESLASSPVGPISFTARGQATWTPARRELSELRGELAMGAARVLLTGALAWPKDAYRVDLRAELPRVKCQAAFNVVPKGLLDELSTLELAGTIKAKVDVHVDSADLDATKIDFDFVDRCRFATVPEMLDVARFSRPFTHRVLEPDGTLFEKETGPGTADWTPIEEISPFVIQAVVASEDGRFFRHSGFAESQIGPALARNLEAHAFKFGASTITMQLVKNAFLQRDKLLARKGQEALIVWWLEQEVDKKWILELYLNLIEYAPAVYGIRNAALHYFGLLPIQLTPAQCAFLATVLPSPKAYDKQFTKGTLERSTKTRIAKFLRHMRARDRIDDEALAYGLEELAHFEFYDPKQPLPVPPPQRGAAQAPPFQEGPIEGWSTYDPATKVEGDDVGWARPSG
jgi:hypothetical protein